MAYEPTRAGRYVTARLTQPPQTYRAFIPAPLPPEPPIEVDAELAQLLSLADQAVGRLDGAARLLRNPELFVAKYVQREAVLSSQIEGTQSTLEDVLTFAVDPAGQELPRDVTEVVNYVAAMEYGLNELTSRPLTLRLIREMHAILLREGRGQHRRPGEFRTEQNWIGAGKVAIAHATFVPPPPDELQGTLDALERFLNTEPSLPTLLAIGLAHAQFETIHPFLDGNGRIGRLLITLLLCQRGVLRRPLLYLSRYLKWHRAEYYDRLNAIRQQGDWEGWLRFFLAGVAATANEATAVAEQIVDLRERHRELLQRHRLGQRAFQLLDYLFEQPIVTTRAVELRLGVSNPTALKLITGLEALGLLVERTGRLRNRRYAYALYLELFSEAPPSTLVQVPPQTTESAYAALFDAAEQGDREP